MSLKTTQINHVKDGVKTARTKVLITSKKIPGLQTQIIKERYGYAQRIKTANIPDLKNKYNVNTIKQHFSNRKNKKFRLSVEKLEIDDEKRIVKNHKLVDARKIRQTKENVDNLYKLQNGDQQQIQTDFITRNGSRLGKRTTAWVSRKIVRKGKQSINNFFNQFAFVKKLKKIAKRLLASMKKLVFMLFALVLAVIIIYLPIMAAVSTVTSVFGSGDKTVVEKYDDYIARENEYWDLKIEIAVDKNPDLEVITSGYTYIKTQSSIDWRVILAVTQAYFMNEGINARQEEFALLNELSENGLMQVITITETQIIIITPTFDDVINYILDTRDANELDGSFIELADMLCKSSDLLSNLNGFNIRNSGIGSWTTSPGDYLIRTTRPSSNDSRWYSNDSPFYRMIDDRGHYLVNECTWYAYGRGSEILGIKNFEEILGTGHFIRDACNWYADNTNMQRQGSGFNSSTNILEVKKGAIFVLSRNGDPGHVGIIEKVNEDGTVNISHGGQGLNGFQYVENIRLDTYFWSYTFVGYIYLIE